MALVPFGLVLGVTVVFARPGNQSSRIDIVAHRGVSSIAPENTLASINMAWQLGANVEVDVHLTKDHQIVAIHDKSTRRTAGIHHVVKDTTYESLKKLDVGRFKGRAFQGESIPLLSQILETMPSSRMLFVEIKCGAEILPYLDREFNRSGKRHQMTIIGFELKTVTAAKERMPDIPTYWLRATRKDRAKKRQLPHDVAWIQAAKQRRLDGLDVHAAGVTRAFAHAVKRANLKLYVWTVDNIKTARRLAWYGVTGITTNRPEFLLNLGREFKSVP